MNAQDTSIISFDVQDAGMKGMNKQDAGINRLDE